MKYDADRGTDIVKTWQMNTEMLIRMPQCSTSDICIMHFFNIMANIASGAAGDIQNFTDELQMPSYDFV